jgi:hypothetical protein
LTYVNIFVLDLSVFLENKTINNTYNLTTVDPFFDLIQVSSSIKIKRSDGQIHLDKIVQLSSKSKSVSVKWNEHGEVKGKEI